jgi:hypothetical protein
MAEEEKWTNVQLDSQILSSFMACPQKMDYVFNRHLIPIGGVAPAFEKGQLAHIGLHNYWKKRIEIGDYQAAAKAALEKAKEESLKFKNLSSDDSLEVYMTLIDFFKFIQNSSWIPIATEQPFKFVAYEDPILRLRIILTGRIDLIVRTPQVKILPIDSKSESERWFHSQMSNQFKIYALACKSNILGVQRIGFQKTLKDAEKFKLELIPFDPDVLEEFRTITLPHFVKQLLIAQEEKFYPMNTTNCVHGHFKCQFSDGMDHKGICNVSRAVREQKLARYFTIGEEWNPMEF